MSDIPLLSSLTVPVIYAELKSKLYKVKRESVQESQPTPRRLRRIDTRHTVQQHILSIH